MLFFIVKGTERGSILCPCTGSCATGYTAVSPLLQRYKNNFIDNTRFCIL